MICDTCTRLGHACRHRITALHEVIEGRQFEDCPYYRRQRNPWLWCLLLAMAAGAIVGAVIGLLMVAV